MSCSTSNPTDPDTNNPVEVVGVNRFILVYRIDHLTDYSQNHYEILDPFNPNRYEKIAWELGTIATRPESQTCGGSTDTISDYRFFVYDRELRMLPVSPLFVPENTQFLILLNKSIPWGSRTFKIINKRVNDYTIQRTPKFVEATTEGLYQNIKYDDFEYDPLTIFDDDIR